MEVYNKNTEVEEEML